MSAKQIIFGMFGPTLVVFLLVFSVLKARGQSDSTAYRLLDRTPEIRETSDGVERGQGPEALKANKRFIRLTGSDDSVRIQLDCHPDRRNYLTVKIWGGSGSSGSKLKLSSAGLLVHQRTENPFPKRFYYATQPLPRSKTKGKSTVTVKLQLAGDNPGPELYNVYTHTGRFFQPPADELQGEPFELGPAAGDGQSNAGTTVEKRFEHWKQQADRLVERTLNFKDGFQIYGEKWKDRIENGGDWSGVPVPAETYGALLRKPNRRPTQGSYAERFDKNRAMWLNWLAEQMGPNMVQMHVLQAWARAYNAEWSKYYQDEELLNRVVAALDFYTRAQARNGGFIGPTFNIGNGPNRSTWIGGPDRGTGHHGLEEGQGPMYRAFNLLSEPMEAAGLLDKPIDNDLDPDTPKLPREEAYAKMAERSFSHLAGAVRGRNVANQALLNMHGVADLYNLWKTTAPDKASEVKPKVRELSLISAGIKRQPAPGDHYLFSPDGMNNEVRYTAGGYGKGNPNRLAKVARQLEGEFDPDFFQDRLTAAWESYSHFIYYRNDGSGNRKLYNTGWISSRSGKGIPGTETYMRDYYAATERELPVVIRHHELYEQHHKSPSAENLLRPDPDKLDLPRTVNGMLDRAERLQQELEMAQGGLPESDYRLPAERKADSAYADPHMQDVALRHGDATLFLECWTDNQARLRYRTPEFERLAHIPFTNDGPSRRGKYSCGDMLNTIRYGPYFIVLNGSEKKRFTYDVPEAFQGRKAKELLSGSTGTLSNKQKIPPMSSRVFVVGEGE